MQSSLLHIHCRFGTARGVPFGAGRGIAISRSLSVEEHCGHVGCESVITTSPGEVFFVERTNETTKKPRFAGLLCATTKL
jgi:hypothetical protein